MAAVHQFHHHPYAFGDFPMDMEDGPFFGHHGHPPRHPHGGHPPPPPFWDHFHGHWQNQGPPDHPDIPGEADDASSSDNEGTPAPPAGPGDHAGERGPEGRRRGPHRGRGRGHHRGGPRAFHGHGHGHPPFPPFYAGFARGRGGFPGHRGAFHGHGPHFGQRGGPFHAPPPPFMSHFAAMAGMDMNHMMGHWPRHGNEEIDFIPRADLFDTANEFVVHVSLPGAKKSDLSVEYDASHSTLRLRGVVHRPGMTEEMNRAFIFDERAFETGVFERKIRLGHPRKPAHVDSDRISASLNDGVLLVTLPKLPVDPKTQNKKIPVEVADEKPSSAGEDTTTTENSPPTAELDAMTMDSETVKGEQEDEMHTPDTESEASDAEEEGHEYVKVDVQ